MPRSSRPDDVEIAWSAHGEGPTVVVCPPFHLPPEAFRDLRAELAGDHRVVTYDLRGAGQSTRRGPYELETDAADLVGVVEEAGAPAVAVCVGDGCNRAVRAAAARPDVIDAVVMSNNMIVGRVDRYSASEGLAASRSVLQGLIRMFESDYATALRAMITSGNPGATPEFLDARIAEVTSYCPQEPALARLRAWIGDEMAAAPAVGSRLTILWHDTNPWFPADLVAEARESVPEARFERVDDGPLSRPDLTAAVVREITSA